MTKQTFNIHLTGRTDTALCFDWHFSVDFLDVSDNEKANNRPCDSLANSSYPNHLRELSHDILGHFFDGLNNGLIVEKPKNNGLPRKKNTKGVILKQKGTRMAEDREDWNKLELMTILKSLANFFQKTRTMT